MTDKSKAAASAATRILDRIEWAWTSKQPILKSDIEHEVVAALDQVKPKTEWIDEAAVITPEAFNSFAKMLAARPAPANSALSKKVSQGLVKCDPNKRASGTTTAQMLAAPRGALYIIPTPGARGYMRTLARNLGRHDLRIETPFCLNAHGICALRNNTIVLDHATRLTSDQNQTLDVLVDQRGIEVITVHDLNREMGT